MGGERADCLITDPPYNVAVVGGTADKLTIENDDMGDAQFDDFLGAVFRRAAESLKPGAAFYVWHASRTQRAFENAMNAHGMECREQLVWVMDNFTLGRQDYQWRHELCWYGWMPGAAHKWTSDRSQTTVADLLPNALMKRRDGAIVLKLGGKEYALKPDAVVEEVKGTVLSFPKPTKSDLHPTMKPIPVIREQIENSTDWGDVVLDLFGGSGTTLMACEKSGRKCRMMELDPKYATVILNRWEAETGQKAELIQGGAADGEGVQA
jgi:DNA modification methylase